MWATHCAATSNNVRFNLLTSRNSVLFPFYLPIKMKLTSAFLRNRKVTLSIFNKITRVGCSIFFFHFQTETLRFTVQMLFSQQMKHITISKTLKCIKFMFCGVSPKDLKRNMDIKHRRMLIRIWDANSNFKAKIGQCFFYRRLCMYGTGIWLVLPFDTKNPYRLSKLFFRSIIDISTSWHLILAIFPVV